MQYFTYCPICGSQKTLREARYTKPPKKEARYEHEQKYDYCEAF